MHRIVLLFAFVLVALPVSVLAQPGLLYEPGDTTPPDASGRGTHVVLVSGDEEYRSEEALPQLAAILSKRHGFTCTVLFAIDPETGTVNPDERRNIPGLEVLKDADCLVLFTRFRDLPDDQMAHVDAYLRAGRPVLGIRTATHAFNLSGDSVYRPYTWNHNPGEDADEDAAAWAGGFGRLVLGETWIAHHGAHGSQSTRGVIAPDAADHPIARGLGAPDQPLPGMDGIWGPTDVYRVRLPMPDGVEPIILGHVLTGMDPDSAAVEGEQNDPAMPIAWTKPYQLPGGEPGMSATSTLGASTDLVASGSRRLLVNTVYWLCGLAEKIPASGTDARIVGGYDPTPYGFGGARRGLTPDAFSPLRANAAPIGSPETLELRDGDRVVLIGNTFAERLAGSGFFASLVHAAHPDLDISVRHVPWAADEVGNRPRERSVPTVLERLHALDATVIVACYGMSESFGGDAGLERFSRDATDFLRTLTTTAFAPDGPPRVALISPIAHEDLGSPWVTGAALAEHNRQLASYTESLRTAADNTGAAFVDLLGASIASDAAQPLTTNGIHPTEDACRHFTHAIGASLGWNAESTDRPSDEQIAAAQRARRRAADLYYHERLWFRPTNTEYAYGRRHEPFGVVSFPPEFAQLERMIDARDRALNNAETGGVAALLAAPLDDRPLWEEIPTSRDFPEDDWTPNPVVAKGTETSLGDLEIKDPDSFRASFTLADGYTIEAFASEQDFPELENPLALTFDERHRLWTICAPTYPHLLPGEQPRCRIVVLEDTDADGRADSLSTFADRLYIPTGFAVDTDCVYVGQAPDLLRLADTDGDGRADVREVVATGFSMPDSHHTLSAFEWDPHGGILMHEGVFGISGVESPWGTLRSRDAAVWRYDTRTRRLTRMSHSGFANPWGHAFNDYGQSVLADASGGANFSFSHVINPAEGVRKPGRGDQILNRGRPTAGCEIIASRHFPDDVQGTFLVNQSIGFHGTRWSRLTEPDGDASAWSAEAMPQDLVESSEVNFRPVAMEIGPDGTLYIADWCNPLIGHMQYSIRDPRRDATHGRIWRVRHETRDTLTPPAIPDAGTRDGRLALLELLRLPETNTRRHARRQLQRADTDTVLSEAESWVSSLSADDPLRERLHLELLWLARAHGRADLDLLARVATLTDPRVRAGAIRILRHWLAEGVIADNPALRLLTDAARDPDMRVRLEAVVASGFSRSPFAVSIAEIASSLPTDKALDTAISEAVRYLGRLAGEATGFARAMELESMDAEALVALPAGAVRDRAVLTRPDVPIAARREAAARAASNGGAAALIRAVLDARNPDAAATAVAPLLLESPNDSLTEARSILASLAEQPGRAGALGLATLEHIGAGSLNALPEGDERLLGIAEILPAGTIDGDLLGRLLNEAATESADPTRTASALARHAADPDHRTRLVDAFSTEWVAPAAERPLDTWNNNSELAAAGLRGLATIAATAPGPMDVDPNMVIDLASPETLGAGEAIYHTEALGCVRCHADDGSGLEGFPPLARSAWVHGAPDRSIAIVLHGLYGNLAVPGDESYNSAMAPLGQLMNDEEVAAVLTYVRQSFGNFAPPVSPARVAAVRDTRAPQEGMWRVDEVLARYPLGAETILPGAAATGDTPVRQASRGSSRPGSARALTLGLGAILGAALLTIVLAVVFARMARGAA